MTTCNAVKAPSTHAASVSASYDHDALPDAVLATLTGGAAVVLPPRMWINGHVVDGTKNTSDAGT